MASAITVSASRRVRPENVAKLEEELKAFFTFAAAQPGCDGLQLLAREGDHESELIVIAGFADHESRRRFVQSDDYQTWMTRLDKYATEPVRIEEQEGLKLLMSGASVGGPPVWKTTAVTWLGVNLVTTCLLPLAPHVLSGVPFPYSNFLFNLPVVTLLAWPVMPLLTRLFRKWLSKA